MTEKVYWIANYIYVDDEGQTRLQALRIEAATETLAREIAVSRAPAAEFVVTVHEETADQFLGQVRRHALFLRGRNDRQGED